ncbi:XK-related protein 9 [Sardina pilchardus]|uniref:XK-related protein 9 n=1 Tax=Sardina pilchardus TaxID=27697 RepID=UPI002E11CECA
MGTAELSILIKEATKAEVKMNVASRFTKKRWILTVIGLILYAADIVLDIILGLKYLKNGHLVWGILTLVFILCASVCTQIFSYMWFRDDKLRDGTKESWHLIIGLHLSHMGIFTRYSQMLIDSFKVVWCKSTTLGNDHLKLFGQATDLSMLRLFEAFLESVPQLLLQLYIFLLGHGHNSVIHYLSMAASFLNVAWAVVDYRRCLRRSLPQLKEMPNGLPTIVYLLYKLFAISARIFSLSLLLVLSPFSILYLALVWFLSTVWAFFQKTDFCTSTALEILYRAIVGIILVFTFFNIQGQGTRAHMPIYYIFYVLQSISAPLFLWMWKPEVLRYEYGTGIIIAGLSIGLGLLCVYYGLLHQGGEEEGAEERVADQDEVDNMHRQVSESVISPRMKKFLQI